MYTASTPPPGYATNYLFCGRTWVAIVNKIVAASSRLWRVFSVWEEDLDNIVVLNVL